ncbi:MAG TPA: baseplate J/gp47 family protein [Candidatus Dormibacteraeota bacterium]
MPIPVPNLDDRDFDDLVADAQRLVRERSPDWTDLGPSDPGTVLIEAFAHLTDVMLYRLNRIPEKVYIELLGLLGVRLYPPSAASATLLFSLPRPAGSPVEIPRGTRVTTSRPGQGSDGPVFVTVTTGTIPAQGTQVEIEALCCDLVDAEPAGVATGRPGLSVVVSRPPIVAPSGDHLDLVVGVEALPQELGEHVPALEHEGRTYRIWSEVDSFATTAPSDAVYVADRHEGRVTFAPAVRHRAPDGGLGDSAEALAAVPAAGREIRIWYRSGGGPQGNVPAGTLTVLKDPITGVQVTNTGAATGGRAGESLDNALVRGPQELRSLDRAVTARDFEQIALGFGPVERARAFTRAALWNFATAGTVEVVLVPQVPAEQRPDDRVTAAVLAAQQTEESRAQVQAYLDERTPLGTRCLVTWARYKPAGVQARLHVHREEDATAVRERVLHSLNASINPLPDGHGGGGWVFGQPLRISDVYYLLQREPGVRWVESLQVQLDEVPDAAVTSIAADRFQPDLWYVAAGQVLFTSRDDGRGWEPAGRFPDGQLTTVRPHPGAAGLVAVGTSLSAGGSMIHVSHDCGESWTVVAQTTQFDVRDLAWVVRDGHNVLLVATGSGLYELPLESGATPVQVAVDPKNVARGLYALTAGVVRGMSFVAAAAESGGGVYVSRDAGRTGTFRPAGMNGQDVRTMAVQRDGPRGFLWAGITVEAANDPGHGCASWELAEQDPPEGWQAHSAGWQAGSCRGIAFAGEAVIAASHHGGVMQLSSRAAAQWQASDVNSGLPLRDPGRFEPVLTVAASPSGGTVMAGGGKGIAASRDVGVRWTNTARRVLVTDDVTLPPNWLLCSGEHAIEVVPE